jgi:non-ribosomal peptide synthetase component E (peptide arylation enzyme)
MICRHASAALEGAARARVDVATVTVPARAASTAPAAAAAPSYASGASQEPLLGLTLGAAFDASATAHSDRVALVVRHQKLRYTYAELRAKVDNFAAALLQLGLQKARTLARWWSELA